jgi:hypothetical protein
MAIGVVDYATPVGVMPWALCKAFRRQQAHPLRRNAYAGGEVQAASLATLSRKAWGLAQDLSAADLATLRTFYLSHNGIQIPFIFYDVNETSPAFSYDPTGTALDGQYICRFDGDWQESFGLGRRAEAQLQIIEVA